MPSQANVKGAHTHAEADQKADNSYSKLSRPVVYSVLVVFADSSMGLVAILIILLPILCESRSLATLDCGPYSFFVIKS